MPFGEEFSSSLLIEVEGQALPDDVAALLESAYVDDSRSVPDLFVLRFGDERATVLDKGGFRIGAKVALKVQRSGSGGPETLLSGEVTALEAEIGSDGAHVVVRGLDVSHRLFRGRRVEAYRDMTASDVVRKVAQRAGLRPGVIDSFPTVLTHLAQDGTNDWDLLRRLADEVGAVVSVNDGALDFRKPTEASTGPSGQGGARDVALIVERGVNIISLRATVTSAGQVPEVEVRGWDPRTKKELVGVAPAATVSAVIPGTDPKTLAQAFKSPAHVEPGLRYEQQSQVDAAARALADRIAGGFAELEGVVRGNPAMRAGEAVAVRGMGAHFDGRYTLSATRHDFSADGYTTSFTVASSSERSLYGVVSGAGGTSGAPIGVLNATVTNLKDPDGLGRVKVSFPVLSDSYESWWARTVQPGAGQARGAVVLPEVGDEVLVAFGQGSFDQPYILGGLFNGKDKPDKPWSDHVDSNGGAVTRRVFASRTGMVVEHLEASGKEQLTLSTNSGAQKVSLIQKPDAAIEIVSEGPLTVTAKKDITISTSGGDVSIKGMNVSIEATSTFEAKGVNVKATGTASTEVKGATVKVAADASAELSGGAMVTVRGALVKIN